MPKPYTIRMFLPDGNPDSIKVIDKMNWTGIGVEVARSAWQTHKGRDEFDNAGVYILVGYIEGDELPTVYIGQADCIRNRINTHEKKKAFWDKVVVFTSSNSGLNRAHITWLEWALLTKAIEAKRCNPDNSATPSEPTLSESEKADVQEFLDEILSILPLVEIKVFDKAKKIEVESPGKTDNTLNTIVVPAQEEGFNEVFLQENAWYAIRIGGGKLKDIKYIAAYQTAPVSAITHYAEVQSIEPYGDGGKYKLNFSGAAKTIGPIIFGEASAGTMQSPRYTNFNKLKTSKTLVELFG